MSQGARARRWTFERGGGAAGLAATLLMVVSTALTSVPDEGKSSDQQLADFYSDSGTQLRVWAGALVGIVAALLFLWFFVALRDRLARVEPSGLPTLVLGAGLVFVVFALLAGMVGTALPAGLVYSEELELTDFDALRVVLILGNHYLSGAAATIAAVVVFSSSFLARRHHLYARWLAWAGMVVAVLMVPGLLFAGFLLVGFMVWAALTGVWLVRGEPAG